MLVRVEIMLAWLGSLPVVEQMLCPQGKYWPEPLMVLTNRLAKPSPDPADLWHGGGITNIAGMPVAGGWNPQEQE